MAEKIDTSFVINTPEGLLKTTTADAPKELKD